MHAVAGAVHRGGARVHARAHRAVWRGRRRARAPDRSGRPGVRGPLGRALLGGVGERLAQGLPCALAVAPRGYADRNPRLRRIGVAYDASPEADGALRWAIALGLRTAATVGLYRVLQFPHMAWGEETEGLDVPMLLDEIGAAQRREAEQALARVPAELAPRLELLEGPVASALAAATAGDDLLVVGSRGYGRVHGVVAGHAARSLMNTATCPVVVLPRAAGVGQGLPEPGEAGRPQP